MSEQSIEEQIQTKGLNDRRVRIEQIDRLMEGVRYETHVVPGTTTTIATAISANGFTLACEVSACASPNNFDEEIGRRIAVERCERVARDELWKLEGWRLKRSLEQPQGKVKVCGVDCQPGSQECNGYCVGDADRPPPLQEGKGLPGSKDPPRPAGHRPYG